MAYKLKKHVRYVIHKTANLVIAFVGLINQGKNPEPERILKLLIYAAAEAGAMGLIEAIFSLPVGRTVFEVYKNDSALPEDIAEENGHREVAEYLRGITERSVEFQVHFIGCPETRGGHKKDPHYY